MNGNFVVNEGYDYTDTLSGEHMTHRSRYPIFPTNRGWTLLNSYSFARTPPLPLNYSNQFTIEFECFTFYYARIFMLMHPNVSEQESSRIDDYLWAEIDDSYAEVDNDQIYSIYDYSFKLDTFRWSKVYVSFQKMDNTSYFQACFYKRVMFNDTDSATKSYDDHWFTVNSTYYPSFEELVVSFYTNDIILKNVKFYKYAMNFQTVIDDMGSYIDPASDKSNTNFANGFYDGYYYKFRSDSYSK